MRRFRQGHCAEAGLNRRYSETKEFQVRLTMTPRIHCIALLSLVLASAQPAGAVETLEGARRALNNLPQGRQMDIRVECGRGKFVAHDVLRDGVGEHEVALTCMAAQDVTATDMLENNPNYPANDLIADSLAILSAPDLFTKNGGKDGKPKVDDTNPTTGKNYTLSMYENILQRAASGALTYTEPDGIEKPIYCELAAEIGFQFGVIQATNPNAGEQPLVQYANLMADGVATAAMYACYDKKPGNFQWGENDLPEAFVGLVAGVRRGMAAVSLKIE